MCVCGGGGDVDGGVNDDHDLPSRPSAESFNLQSIRGWVTTSEQGVQGILSSGRDQVGNFLGPSSSDDSDIP